MATLDRSAPSDESDDEQFVVEEWPFYWLTQAVGLYLMQLERALKRVDLDVARWRVLMSLHDDAEASVSELAERAIVKLTTMTRIVQRMQAEGLVTSRPRESDGRVTEVSLTEKGRQARKQAWKAASRVYERAFARASRSEINKLNQLLRQLFDRLSD